MEADDACLGNEVSLTRINSFLEDAFHSSCEGIMVKCLDVDAGYSPSKRTDTWLKVLRSSKIAFLYPTTTWCEGGKLRIAD